MNGHYGVWELAPIFDQQMLIITPATCQGEKWSPWNCNSILSSVLKIKFDFACSWQTFQYYYYNRALIFWSDNNILNNLASPSGYISLGYREKHLEIMELGESWVIAIGKIYVYFIVLMESSFISFTLAEVCVILLVNKLSLKNC